MKHLKLLEVYKPLWEVLFIIMQHNGNITERIHVAIASLIPPAHSMDLVIMQSQALPTVTPIPASPAPPHACLGMLCTFCPTPASTTQDIIIIISVQQAV